MHDIRRLLTELRQTEYETAVALFDRLITEGYPQTKVIAMVYRAGLVDGRKMQRDREARNAYFTALNAQPEAKEESEVAINE